MSETYLFLVTNWYHLFPLAQSKSSVWMNLTWTVSEVFCSSTSSTVYATPTLISSPACFSLHHNKSISPGQIWSNCTVSMPIYQETTAPLPTMSWYCSISYRATFWNSVLITFLSIGSAESYASNSRELMALLYSSLSRSLKVGLGFHIHLFVSKAFLECLFCSC